MEVGGLGGVAGSARLLDMQGEEAEAQALTEAAKRNRGFAQVYSKGWQRIRQLADQSPAAVKLYALLAEHVDGTAGAVVASQALLASLLGVSERTVRRLSNDLENAGAVARIRIGAGMYAYALNPAEVWKSWDTRKSHAAFLTKTLADPKAAREGAMRMRAMLGSQGQMFVESADADK